MERGKAKPGEKTIIDSLHPAAHALEEAAARKVRFEEGVTLAYQAALDGLEETKKMNAEHGRASYYGENSIGKQDPDETVGMLLVKAFYDFVNENR
jgi:dihydroxyacetone kinase-like protein